MQNERPEHPAWKAANATSASSVDSSGLKHVVTMGDTAVSKLLNHDVFKAAVLSAAGGGDTFNLIRVMRVYYRIMNF